MGRAALVVTVLSGLLCISFVVACVYTNVKRTGIVIWGPIPLDLSRPMVQLNRSGATLWNHGPFALLPGSYTKYTSLGVDFGTGLLWGMRAVPDGTRVYVLDLPYWLLISVTAVSPAAYAVYLRRVLRVRSRGKHGLCLTCGYDLRASKERCPECGTAVMTTESKA